MALPDGTLEACTEGAVAPGQEATIEIRTDAPFAPESMLVSAGGFELVRIEVDGERVAHVGSPVPLTHPVCRLRMRRLGGGAVMRVTVRNGATRPFPLSLQLRGVPSR